MQLVWGLWLSGTTKKLVSQMSRFDFRQFLFFSCVYQELINDKSKHKKKMLLFVLYSPGLLTVIYNMYKSMTS